MDLLAAYGSDDDVDEDAEELTKGPIALALEPLPHAMKAPHASSGALSFSTLPLTSSIASSSLPAPSVVKKKVVKLPHASLLLAPDSDEDEKEAMERASKRAKIAAMKEGRKSMLLGFLPPPVNDKQAMLGGGGGGGRLGQSKGRKHGHDDDEDDDDDPVIAAGRGDGGAASLGLTSNEAYKVHEEEEGGMPGEDYYYQQGHQAAADGGGVYYEGQQQPGGGYGVQATGAGVASSSSYGMDLPPELMGSGIQFKEINAKDLRYVEPAKAAAAPTLKSILGQEFANKLRAEADSFGGTSLAKKKHQIGTLFATARANELNILDGKSQAMKSKSETQSKYGW